MCVHEWAQTYHRRKVRMHAEGGTSTRRRGGQSRLYLGRRSHALCRLRHLSLADRFERLFSIFGR